MTAYMTFVEEKKKKEEKWGKMAGRLNMKKSRADALNRFGRRA